MATAMRWLGSLSTACAALLACHARPSATLDAGADSARAAISDSGHKLGSYYPDPILDIGGGQAQINQPTLLWPTATSAPTLTQASTSGATGTNLTLSPQASTATNGTPGNLVFNTPNKTGTGNVAYSVFQGNAGELARIGAWNNANGGAGALWVGPIGTPSITNFSLYSDGSNTYALNSPVTLELLIANGGNTPLVLQSSGLEIGSLTTAFGSGVGVIGIHNATTNPSTNPSSGGVLYVSVAGGNSELFWRDSAGVVTQITPTQFTSPTSTAFTSGGTFTPTTSGTYLIEGCGGGAGGGGGNGAATAQCAGGSGGGGAEKARFFVSLVASTGYTVAIGAGGSTTPTDGSDTTVIGGAISVSLAGAGKGLLGHLAADSSTVAPGGASNRHTKTFDAYFTGQGGLPYQPSHYGGWTNSVTVVAGSDSYDGAFTGGAVGANSGNHTGGGGGGAGAYGNGAAGGAGNNAGVAGNGSNAAANTGGGGGGGGCGTAGNGGVGGTGGSGQVTITGPL